MRKHDSAQALRDLACTEDEVWGHQVVDQAIDFLNDVQDDEPYVLVVSLDEPHGPFVTPPEWQELFDYESVPAPENFAASLAGKPAMQQSQAREFPVGEWRDFLAWRLRHIRCTSYIDYEIGRLIDAIDQKGADNTYVIATSDHGDQMGSHGLLSKGAMMYEESAGIPFMVRGPQVPAATRSQAPVSLLDLLPTFVDLAGEAVPPICHGTSLVESFHDAQHHVQDHVHIQFNRFGIYHDGYAAFYPIRCVTNERYKLAVNLFDIDELYDLQEDPHECHNLIDDPSLQAVKNELLQLILDEQARTDDPIRGDQWRTRPWSTLPAPPTNFFFKEGRGNMRKESFACDPLKPQPI